MLEEYKKLSIKTGNLLKDGAEATGGMIISNAIILGGIGSTKVNDILGGDFGASTNNFKYFIYGDGKDIDYTEGDEITEKIRYSDFLDEKLNEALNSKDFNENDFLVISSKNANINGRTPLISKKEINEGKLNDLYYAIGNANWNMIIEKLKNGDINIDFYLDDYYIFYEDDNLLNKFGYFLQNKGLGKPYKYTIKFNHTIKNDKP